MGGRSPKEAGIRFYYGVSRRRERARGAGPGERAELDSGGDGASGHVPSAKAPDGSPSDRCKLDRECL